MMQVRVITDRQNQSEKPTRCGQCPARAEIVVEIQECDNDGNPYWLGEYLCRDCVSNLARILGTATGISAATRGKE